MGFVASCVEDGYRTGQRPKGCWPVFLPRDDVADVYQLVRLEAGSSHLTMYLIRVTVYILNVTISH